MISLELFNQAMTFAVEKHGKQIRKSTRTPYILHPAEVAAILATMTDDLDVLAAGLLHDVVEDAGVAPEELLDRFGPRVEALVRAETEDKRPGIPPEETWRVRKEESLEFLRECDDKGVKMLWLADKLSNMRSYYRTYLLEGSALWKRFHQADPAAQAWYYRTVAELLTDLKETAAYQEYVRLMQIVFAEIKED